MNLKSLIIALSCYFTVFTIGCESKPTLQTYFVDHQEVPDFISMDVPISFLGADKLQLTDNQQDAIDSIKKLNMLGYSLKSGSRDTYSQEVKTIKSLLKSERYNELMRVGNSKDGRVRIHYVGHEDAIDELVVFGTSKAHGFAVIRVLGNNMDVSKIMELGPILNKLDTRDLNVEGFLDFMF